MSKVMKAKGIDFEVHNYMENIVDNLIKEVFREKPELCNCKTCLLDISAIVLNQVKPQYLKTETNIGKLSPFLLRELHQEVMSAIEQVKQNPRPNHDSELCVAVELQNLSEPLVIKILKDVLNNHVKLENLESLPIIAAMVLNQIEPRYAVTDRGGAYQRLAELELQFLPNTMSIVFNVVKQFQSR